MKTKNSLISLAACVTVVALAGCEKKTETMPDVPTTNTVATVTAPEADTADKAVTMATEASNQIAATATNVVNSATTQFDDLVGKAKAYIADKKYTDALAAINSLSNLTLTPEQQKIVDDLKAEVKKLMSGSAADAAKNLLGK